MKTIAYAAAIALLSASAAFAQSSNSTDMNAGKMNHQPSANDSSMPQSGSMNSDMSGDAGMSSGKAMKHETSNMKAKHVASTKDTRSENSREDQETAKLNQGQLSGNGSMANNGMNRDGTAMNGNGNSFDNGRPQAAQAGGASCTPDNPSCGTARENPAINSSPQHRLQQASPGATSNE